MVSDHKILAKNIRLLLTDCDGVLTDALVYYSADGDELRAFNVRDGMAVERIRNLRNIDVGIITGESSGAIRARAEKLKINHLYLGTKDKEAVLQQLHLTTGIAFREMAYIGDDVNDLGAMALCGFTACPRDAENEVKKTVHFVCERPGGRGAFREFAEYLIQLTQTGG